MRFITGLFAAAFFLGGLAALGYAVIYPQGFVLNTASAVQITQVYTMALYYAAIGTGSLLCAVVILLAMMQSVSKNTAVTG